MDYLHLAGGFIYLLMGADLLVRGSVALARRLRIPSVFVALTVVALGTSLPELVVALRAATTGFPGLVLGNSVGSNIANVLLVFGAAAVIFPLQSNERQVRRDSVTMLVATALLGLLCVGGGLGRDDGLILVLALAVTILLTARAANRVRETPVPTPVEWVLGLPGQRRMIMLFLFAGLVGLPVGAKMVVEASVRIANSLGVSDTVVGLTIVAFSTSLPELATTVVAATQKRTEMAIGTVVGSNTLNIVLILGVAAVASSTPILVTRSFLQIDYGLMVVASLILAGYAWSGRRAGRRVGGVMLLVYAAYVGLTFAIAAD